MKELIARTKEIFREVRNTSLRSRDLKEIYPAYEMLKEVECQFEPEIKKRLQTIAREEDLPINERKIEKAIERIYWFQLGLMLADMKLEGLPIRPKQPPITIIDAEYPQVQSMGLMEFKEGERFAFGIQAKHLLSDDIYMTHVTDRYAHEKTKSISRHLYNFEIVDSITAGVEEYAHLVYSTSKSKDKLIRAQQEYNRIKNITVDDDPEIEVNDASYLFYHTSDIERRALTWEGSILREYLPHWIAGNVEFKEMVYQLRLKKRV